jgi:hypothetical protein
MPNPNGYCNPEQLAMLSRVLKEALRSAADGASVSDAEVGDLGTLLGRVIMARYEAGEREPEALKSAAMESIRSWREVADR